MGSYSEPAVTTVWFEVLPEDDEVHVIDTRILHFTSFDQS